MSAIRGWQRRGRALVGAVDHIFNVTAGETDIVELAVIHGH
jgi:hypothetical protein